MKTDEEIGNIIGDALVTAGAWLIVALLIWVAARAFGRSLSFWGLACAGLGLHGVVNLLRRKKTP